MRRSPSISLGNRDERIADPSSGFVPHYRHRRIELWQCVKCPATSSDTGLFCADCRSNVILRP